MAGGTCDINKKVIDFHPSNTLNSNYCVDSLSNLLFGALYPTRTGGLYEFTYIIFLERPEKYHLTCTGNADNFAIKQVNYQDESQHVKTDWSIEAVGRDSRCQTILSNNYSIQVIYVRKRRIIMD